MRDIVKANERLFAPKKKDYFNNSLTGILCPFWANF